MTAFILIMARPALFTLLSFFILVIVFSFVYFKKKNSKWTIPAIILLVLSFGNILTFGAFGNHLIYKFGEDATAVITHQKITMHGRANDQARFNVLIKTKEELIESHFNTLDFNIYPAPKNKVYSYPSPGQEFSIKYIPKKPNLFVIIN